MSQANEYVTIDKDGAMYVGEARVPMEAIVIAFHNGDSPEGIRGQYRALTLEEVYGGIAYYLANEAAVAEYMKRQDEIWKKFTELADKNPSPLVQRLRALKPAGARTR